MRPATPGRRIPPGPRAAAPAGPVVLRVGVVPVPEPEPAVKNRTHLDLATTSPDHQAELVAHREVYRDTGPIAAAVADCADPRAMARFWGAATDWPVRRATGDLAVLRCPGQGPLPRVPPGARPEDRAVSWTCPTDPKGHEFRVLTRS